VSDEPAGLPGQPHDDRGPVFREPWEAEAFAMALALYERGLFTWSEWSGALAAQIRRAQATGDADLGDTYYRQWLTTLEGLVADKGASSVEELSRYRSAWHHAADRTPHGQPIELAATDFTE
jgi:nitrile hydratase accessory protein